MKQNITQYYYIIITIINLHSFFNSENSYIDQEQFPIITHSNGILSNINEKYFYSPPPNFIGTDTIEYKIISQPNMNNEQKITSKNIVIIKTVEIQVINPSFNATLNSQLAFYSINDLVERTFLLFQWFFLILLYCYFIFIFFIISFYILF